MIYGAFLFHFLLLLLLLLFLSITWLKIRSEARQINNTFDSEIEV